MKPTDALRYWPPMHHPESFIMNPISAPDTLVYIMVSVSAVDSEMRETEMLRIGNIVKTLPVFAHYGPDRLVEAAKACRDILQADEGMDAILQIAGQLPEHLHPTAYALATEIAATDRSVSPEEVRLLQLLRKHLKLDRLTTVALETAARARHQTE
ncbi:MAG: tellurite resistance TerB family protein [Pseudomonadota bacterium]